MYSLFLKTRGITMNNDHPKASIIETQNLNSLVNMIQIKNEDFVLTYYATMAMNRASVVITRKTDGVTSEFDIMLKFTIKENWQEKLEKKIQKMRNEPKNEVYAEFIELNMLSKTNKGKTSEEKRTNAIDRLESILHGPFNHKEEIIENEVKQLQYLRSIPT